MSGPGRPPRRLAGTGRAAREYGMDPATLWRYARARRVKPAAQTPGGQFRFDLEDLRDQLADPRTMVIAVVTSERGVLAVCGADDAGAWMLPGREIADGESVADTAVRAVYDDTGLVVSAAATEEIGRRFDPRSGRTTVYRAATVPPGGELGLHPRSDSGAARWLSLSRLSELPDLYEPVRRLLQGSLPG